MNLYYLAESDSTVRFSSGAPETYPLSTVITAVIISVFVTALVSILITELVHMSTSNKKHTVYLDSPDYYSLVEHKRFMLEEKPVKVGYRFAGWYLDPDFTQSFNLNTPIVKDMYLYAKWEKLT